MTATVSSPMFGGYCLTQLDTKPTEGALNSVDDFTARVTPTIDGGAKNDDDLDVHSSGDSDELNSDDNEFIESDGVKESCIRVPLLKSNDQKIEVENLDQSKSENNSH